jgi:hypothetical protein
MIIIYIGISIHHTTYDEIGYDNKLIKIILYKKAQYVY